LIAFAADLVAPRRTKPLSMRDFLPSANQCTRHYRELWLSNFSDGYYRAIYMSVETSLHPNDLL
jgi:hypothetical protein